MHRLITKVLETRKNIFQAGMMAVLVAIGTNLLANTLDHYFSSVVVWLLIVGVLLIALGFLFLTNAMLAEGRFDHTFDALLLLDQNRKCVVSVAAYPFLENLAKYTHAVFLENEALKQNWETSMFRKREKKPEKKPDEKADSQKKTDSNDVSYISIFRMDSSEMPAPIPQSPLLIEAVEFCLLEFLSLHLSSYFDVRENDDSKIIEIERSHIPEVLLRNRVLSLLSTPIEDRPIFTKLGMHKNPPKGELHAVMSSNGATFERFRLVLPQGTTISRPQPGTILLQHPRYTLTMSVKYAGFSHTLPRYFQECYLSSEPIEVDVRSIKINIGAKLKPRAFISIFDWDYYEWIDSFFQRMEKSVCFDSFLSRIDWQSTSTRIRVTRIESAAAMRKARARAAGAGTGSAPDAKANAPKSDSGNPRNN